MIVPEPLNVKKKNVVRRIRTHGGYFHSVPSPTRPIMDISHNNPHVIFTGE